MRNLIFSLLFCASLCAEPFDRAIVTRSNGDVLFLGKGSVKTGKNSRIELEFPDLTIVRIGSNAFFRFITGSREMMLDSGTLLFSSPKDTEGGTIRAGAIVVRAIGADLEISNVGERVKVICLSGKILVYFSANPKIRDGLRPGQMLDIPPGAAKMPRAGLINLELLMSTGLLMKMGTLRSQAALEVNANKQKPRPQSLVNSPPYISQSRATAAAGSTRQIEAQQSAQVAQQVAQQAAAQQTQQRVAAQQAAQQAVQAAAQELAVKQAAADRVAAEQVITARRLEAERTAAAAAQEAARQLEVQRLAQQEADRARQGNQGNQGGGNQGGGNQGGGNQGGGNQGGGNQGGGNQGQP